jgi:DNA repair protein RadC
MGSFIFVTKPLEILITEDVFTVRVVKYNTKLTDDRKVVLEKEVSVNYPEVKNIIKSPDDVARFARKCLELDMRAEEYLYMLCLNTKNAITSVFELSHGSVNSSIFSVREVFQKALLANAVNIIFVHNHPSGDCTPSRQDVEVTERAVEAGKILGVDVLDHIVIGDILYSSLKEKGYI